ncbi:unnamed protein product [Periconia digitata]|uniref:Uncharacterized protein n=1 Tax=Periconia digitata TaxID=1303443 RepID=A0A9W4U9Q4_9PLEO|nr:unnamed protein product [Periconia digitata]
MQVHPLRITRSASHPWRPKFPGNTRAHRMRDIRKILCQVLSTQLYTECYPERARTAAIATSPAPRQCLHSSRHQMKFRKVAQSSILNNVIDKHVASRQQQRAYVSAWPQRH